MLNIDFRSATPSKSLNRYSTERHPVWNGAPLRSRFNSDLRHHELPYSVYMRLRHGEFSDGNSLLCHPASCTDSGRIELG